MPFLEAKNFKRIPDAINNLTIDSKDSLIVFRGDREVPLRLGLLKLLRLAVEFIGYVPENVANKQNDLTPSSTKYPTVDAVNTGIASVTTTYVKDYSHQFLLMGA
jgi:hypothetical protein